MLPGYLSFPSNHEAWKLLRSHSKRIAIRLLLLPCKDSAQKNMARRGSRRDVLALCTAVSLSFLDLEYSIHARRLQASPSKAQTPR